MTALPFALITSNLLHQQAGALLSHRTFPLGYEETSQHWGTVDGVFLSLWDWVGGIPWARDGMGCIWTVGGFTGHSFCSYTFLLIVARSRTRIPPFVFAFPLAMLIILFFTVNPPVASLSARESRDREVAAMDCAAWAWY